MINEIIHGDCLEVMKEMPDGFVDLTITSPPYNVDLGNNKFNKNGYNSHNDNLKHSDYIAWLKEVFAEIYRITKSGGRCAINIGDGKNGKIPTHSNIINFMTEEIGWLMVATIIWDKKEIGNRTAWGSFNSPKNPSFPKPFEYILFFAKDSYGLYGEGETDLQKELFIKWAYSIWEFPGEKGLKIGHPAPFPQELPKRCMKMLSYKNAIILDPFSGSGTTALTALQQERNYICIEKDKTYFDLSVKRVNDYKSQTKLEFV